MQWVQSGLGAASRSSEGSSLYILAIFRTLSDSVPAIALEKLHQHRSLFSYARFAVPRVDSSTRYLPANVHQEAIHTKVVQNGPHQVAQEEHADSLNGHPSPDHAPGVAEDGGSLPRRWLQLPGANVPESPASTVGTRPQQSPASSGVHRWLGPQGSGSQEHATPQPSSRSAHTSNRWHGPALNGASHSWGEPTQQRTQPPPHGSYHPGLENGATAQNRWQRSPAAAAHRPAHRPEHHPSAGSNRSWDASQSVNGAQRQHQQEPHQRYQRHSSYPATHRGSGTAHPGPHQRHKRPHAPARQVPHVQDTPPPPRSRWLGALRPAEGAESTAAAAPAAVEDGHESEVTASSDEEEAGSERSAAPHRWVTAAHSRTSPRQQRDWLPHRPPAGPAPAAPPRPKRDWTAFAPPKDNMAAMQEQQQKREHMAKVARQQQALNGYQQQPDPMAPLEHGVAASQRSSKSPQRSAPAKFKPPEEIVLPEEVTVLQLASLLKCSLEKLEETLEGLGEKPASYEDRVEVDIAELVALELGMIAIRSPDMQDRDKDAVPRAPVVTVMGHVDHGKTSLLDALRKTAVAASEAGGITQHIGAFEVALPGSKATATFLDTPGHAAFTAMRARGASVTDIVILVVAANDGVMPQTEEAIAHARAADCPIIVALTKCDMPGAEPSRVKNQLLSLGLQLEEAGGSVMVVETAAPKGVGLAELEEAVLLQAEIMDLQASAAGRAEGTVVEARRDKGQGPVATIIVKRGCLQVGDYVAVGTEWGRVRSMRSAAGEAMKEALPGQPVEVAGLRGVPQAGDELMVLPSDDRARRVSEARAQRAEEYRHSRQSHAVRQLAAERAAAAEAAEDGAAPDSGPGQIILIVKADVQGSAEAVRDSVQALASETVAVKVVQVGVGPVTSFDVDMASSTGATIVAFNVKMADSTADALAKQRAVDVLQHRIIYRLLEEVGERMAGAAPRVERENVVGEAQVLQVFQVADKRAGASHNVAGCRVSEGSLRAAARFRLLRAGTVVHEGSCASLKRMKLDVERVGKGSECGVLLEGFDDVQQGDVLHCIEVDMVQPDKEAVLGNVSLQNKA